MIKSGIRLSDGLGYARILYIMKNLQKLFLLALICFLTGCSWFPPWFGTNKTDTPQVSQFVQTGKIVDAQALDKGSTILVIPFTAGSQVEVNEELDRVSLSIVKGASSVLAEKYQVLSSVSANKADIIIRGRVTKIGRLSKFKKWILRKKKIDLGVEGKAYDAKTNQVLAIFSDERQIEKNESSLKELGIIIGQDIGRFLIQERP